MPHGDDLDQRFEKLVSQIDAEEQRRMRASAKKSAKQAPGAGGAEDLRRDAWRAEWEAPEPEPRRGGGRNWAAILGGALAVLTAAALVLTIRPGLLTPSGAVPEETMPVAGSALEDGAAPEAPTPERPFAGSPAEKWAENAAGLVMPEAKAVGGLSKKDVAKALERTRDLLAASEFDHKTLMGGRPTAFIGLLPAEERSWFVKNLDKGKGSEDTRLWVASLAPKTAERVGDVVKVRGTTKVSPWKEDGRTGAKLDTKYIVVHAIQRPGQPHTVTRLVTRQTGTLHVYREDGKLVVWVYEWGRSSTPVRCDVDDSYIHPMYDDSVPDEEGATGPPMDPYELDGQEPEGECAASEAT
ncbi:hypothetical protein AB0I81_21435 [Nonomuraea sp. NPDC050404]|uniref:hypothetical protein n=1 Tax=Nonomuraea sp. NPDC050404 TaxID=3155783 RepID=UPI0033D1A1F2